MSSVFISNCFIKSVVITINSISGTAIYRTEIGGFRGLLFKGFFNSNKDENILHLIQTIIVNDNEDLTEEDLPMNQSQLLIFSGVVQNNSYVEDNTRDHFIIKRKIYNPTTKNSIDSNIYVSYEYNNRYTALKKNLIKCVFSIVGKMRISRSNALHLEATEIEWNFPQSEQKTNNNERKYDDIDDELEKIENKFKTNNKRKKSSNTPTSPIKTPSSTSSSSTNKTPTSSTSYIDLAKEFQDENDEHKK
nr:15585_t:CDS:2 [Entrophospora candida]